MSFATGGNLNERLTEFDRQLKELANIVRSSAIIQSREVSEVAQLRYDVENLILLFGSLNTNIERLFTKIDNTLEKEEKISTTNLLVSQQNAADYKFAANNAVTVSKALSQLLDVFTQSDKLESTQDYLSSLHAQLTEEIGTNERESEEEKQQFEDKKAENLKAMEYSEQLELERRRG